MNMRAPVAFPRRPRHFGLTRLLITTLAGIAVTAAGLSGAAPAVASPTTELYASTLGIGRACSARVPGTVDAAKTRASKLAAKGTDVAVVVAAGVYRLSTPLRFTAADGGQYGGSVSWQAAPGAHPVFTGATKVTGWSLADAANGIYVANVNTEFRTRQLYVDGELAERSRLVVPRSDFSVTATGLRITNPTLATKLAATNVDGLDFSAVQSFTDRFAPVVKIDGDTVTMAQPAWDNNTYGYDTLQAPFRTYQYAFENSRAFLTDPGQWYFDAGTKQLYYKPLAGQNMKSVDVEMPRLENLISISGTIAQPVTNLSFSGLTFAGTSWLGPSGTSGYASQQTGAYISGVQKDRPSDAFTSRAVGCAGFEGTRGTWSQMPGAVQVSAANGISFDGNTFRNLGSDALGIGNDGGANASGVDLGAQDITVSGNTFAQNAGGAIVIGRTQKDAHHPSLTAMTNKNITVTNNQISDSALVYQDEDGIFATYVDGLKIAHNDISDMPYTGIGIGYGWGMWDAGGSPDYQKRGTYNYYPVYQTPTTSKDNLVEANYLHDVMTVMSDGACVYTLSAMPGTQINKNYCNDAHDQFGIYNDEGSRYMTETDNVLADVRAREWTRRKSGRRHSEHAKLLNVHQGRLPAEPEYHCQ
jgi:hypothetical protein